MSQITKYLSPFSHLSDLHQALDQLFDRDFSLGKDFSGGALSQWIPKIDIKEKEDQYIIQADVPGVEPKDIEINLEENGTLTLKGKRESEKKEEKKDFMRIERASGTFYRSLNLPNIGDSSKIIAKFKNGVLEITIPKNKKSISHKIKILEK